MHTTTCPLHLRRIGLTDTVTTAVVKLLAQMEQTAFIESIHYSNKLEGIVVPIERCRELVIGTYDSNDCYT